MHAALRPAADRWRVLEDEPREQFRSDLASFVRLYAFLSQITTYDDLSLEKLASFGRMLLPRLESTSGAAAEVIEGAKLTHFRVQKRAEVQLRLDEGTSDPMQPTTAVGTAVAKTPEQIRLAEIVEAMNDLFAGELTEADLVGYATHVTGKLIEHEALGDQAENNSVEQFAHGDYRKILKDTVIAGQDQYNAMAAQVLDNDRIQKAFADMILASVYEGLLRRRGKGTFNSPIQPHVPPAGGDGAVAG